MGKERTEIREMEEKKKRERERNKTVWKEMRKNDSIDLNFKIMCKKKWKRRRISKWREGKWKDSLEKEEDNFQKQTWRMFWQTKRMARFLQKATTREKTIGKADNKWKCIEQTGGWMILLLAEGRGQSGNT